MMNSVDIFPFEMVAGINSNRSINSYGVTVQSITTDQGQISNVDIQKILVHKNTELDTPKYIQPQMKTLITFICDNMDPSDLFQDAKLIKSYFAALMNNQWK